MTKKRGLGRSLNSLLGETLSASLQTMERQSNADELRHLPLDLLQAGQYQPRRIFEPEALHELAESIRTQGIIQPLVVRSIGKNGHYEIIAGERRWRAAQLAGVATVPVLVRPLSDNDAMAVALIENIQREELKPLEQARAFQRLIDEFKMTHEEVAQAIGRSRAGVTNFLRLLLLNKEVATMLDRGEIEVGHAKVLLALKDQDQLRAARIVAARGLSVRETEDLVQQTKNQKSPAPIRKKMDPDIQKLQQKLSDHLGATVAIDHHEKGRGKLVIAYNSLDELEGILAKMDAPIV